MKKYINSNNKKRRNGANSFEKGCFKLMINSAYGKAMKKKRKRINAGLVNNEKDFLRYSSRPTHVTHRVFSKNYAAIHKIKQVLTLK